MARTDSVPVKNRILAQLEGEIDDVVRGGLSSDDGAEMAKYTKDPEDRYGRDGCGFSKVNV